MFHVIKLDREWRHIQPDLPPLFKSLEEQKPIVAVGANRPLSDQQRSADFFRMHDLLSLWHTVDADEP